MNLIRIKYLLLAFISLFIFQWIIFAAEVEDQILDTHFAGQVVIDKSATQYKWLIEMNGDKVDDMVLLVKAKGQKQSLKTYIKLIRVFEPNENKSMLDSEVKYPLSFVIIHGKKNDHSFKSGKDVFLILDFENLIGSRKDKNKFIELFSKKKQREQIGNKDCEGSVIAVSDEAPMYNYLCWSKNKYIVFSPADEMP